MVTILIGQHCPRTLSMILRWENRSYWMSCMNFDGGVKFNFSTPGSTITSLSLILPYSIYYKTNSFSITKSILSSIPLLPSFFTYYSNFHSSLYFTSSTNSFYNSNSTYSIISFSSSFASIYFN